MPATETRPEDGQQYLSFFFAGEEYATEILRIREVVEYQRLTPVPTTPAWVRGVMNLRGTVVPVLDLAIKLQQTETPVEKLTCIVIFEVDLEGEPTPVGVMIDQVGRVFELRDDQIHEPPAFGSPVRPELLEGIGMIDDKPVPVLHIQKVLTEDELAATVAETDAAVVGGEGMGAPADGGKPRVPKDTGKPPEPKAPSKKPSKANAKGTADPKPSKARTAPRKSSKSRSKAGKRSKTKGDEPPRTKEKGDREPED